MTAKNHGGLGVFREEGTSVARFPARAAISAYLRSEAVVFAGVVVVYLLPIWIFSFFPSQDGPAHLANANVLRQYYSPEAPVFREYYALNGYPNPNWFGHVVLAGLMYVVSVPMAEKLLLSGYILLLPLSVRYMTGAVHSGFLGAFLVLPFVYNLPLQMGFYNFCYSLVMYFFCVGYWLRNQDRFRTRDIVALATLSLLLYFSHPLSLVMAYMTVAVLLVFRCLYDSYPNHRANIYATWRTFRSRVAFPAIAFLPSLGLMLWFLGHQATGVGGEGSVLDPWVLFRSLVSYQRAERTVFIALGLGLGLVAGAVIISRAIAGRVLRWDGFLAVLGVFVLVLFLAPKQLAGGSIIQPRLVLYVWFAFIIWLAVQNWPIIVTRTLKASAAGLGLALLALHSFKFAEINSYLREYTSAARFLEPNTTLLPVVFWDRRKEVPLASVRVNPFRHAADYIAAERTVVNLDNYEARTGYFPLRFRPEVDPYVHIGNSEKNPLRLKFLSYSQRTRGHVDYVLVWGGVYGRSNTEASTEDFFRQLDIGFELIYTSPEHGLTQLYRRRKAGLPPAEP